MEIDQDGASGQPHWNNQRNNQAGDRFGRSDARPAPQGTAPDSHGNQANPQGNQFGGGRPSRFADNTSFTGATPPVKAEPQESWNQVNSLNHL